MEPARRVDRTGDRLPGRASVLRPSGRYRGPGDPGGSRHPETDPHVRLAPRTKREPGRGSGRALSIDSVVGASGHLVPVDLTPPGASLAAAVLDELLEALQVALHSTVHRPQLVPYLLGHTLGLEHHLQGDPGLVVVERVKRHHPSLIDTRSTSPGDALVGALLGDLGLELALHAGDVHVPTEMAVVELIDPLHALHEAWELFELCPLVVD